MSVLSLLPLLLAAPADSVARVSLADTGMATRPLAGTAVAVPAAVPARSDDASPPVVRGSRVRVGLVNVDDDSVDVQVGLVNIARAGAGKQIGLWNRSRAGAPLSDDKGAPCSWSSSWRFQGDAWGTESGIANAGVVVGWRHLNLLGGASLSAARGTHAAGGYFGVGGEWRGERGWFGVDLIGTGLMSDSAWRQVREEEDLDSRRHHGRHDDRGTGNHLATLRLSAGTKVWKRLEVYGGVTGNVLDSRDAEGGTEAKYLAPPGAYHWDATGTLRLWPGAFVGIRI